MHFCVAGFGGVNCEHRYNECESSPCLNGGVCVDLEDSWQCHCGIAFTGVNCSEKVPLCDPSPCQNAVECTDHGTSYTCSCKPGFSGIWSTSPLL